MPPPEEEVIEKVVEEEGAVKEEGAEGAAEEGAEGGAKSDDDWKTVFDQLKKDNESLKGELTKRDSKHAELEETIEGLKKSSVPASSPTPNIDHWRTAIVNEAARQFSSESPVTVAQDGSVSVNEKALRSQFAVMVNTTDQMVGAILRDKVVPVMTNIYEKAINLGIENQILVLKMERTGLDSDGNPDDSPKFSDFEPEIRKALSKLPSDQKDKDGIVREMFLRVAGSSLLNKPRQKQAEKPPIKDQLKDLSAGSGLNGSGAGKGKARLTEAQEKDRQDMSRSFEYEVDPADYISQLEARRKRMKAEGKKIPETLREWE